MANNVLKYHNGTSWVPVVLGAQGIQGATGGASILNTVNTWGANQSFSDSVLSNLTISDYQETVAVDTNLNGSVTVANNVNVVRYTLTGNSTITLPTDNLMPAGSVRTVTIIVKQDATGGRTLTISPPAGFTLVWNNSATMPELNLTANKSTIYTSNLVKGITQIFGSLSFFEG